MFGLGLATKIYVAVEAVDMRKGFEGLYGLVRDQLGAGPAERTSVPVFESHTHASESPGVGWQRIMGVREAVGERPLSLARGQRETAERDDARRGVGDAGERTRSEAGAATQVVPAFGIKSSGTFSPARVK